MIHRPRFAQRQSLANGVLTPHTPPSLGHWSRKSMLPAEGVTREFHDFLATRAQALTANQITLGERNGPFSDTEQGQYL